MLFCVLIVLIILLLGVIFSYHTPIYLVYGHVYGYAYTCYGHVYGYTYKCMAIF